MMPPARRPLTMTERRDLKRRLGVIADALAVVDEKEKRLRETRAELRREQDALSAQVYRS